MLLGGGGKCGSENSKCDGIYVTIMQSSPSLQSAIMQSLPLSLFVTMKIETEQI